MSNKYKHFNQSQAELDYHNMGPMTHQQIIDIADEFIEDCLANNYKRVTIITGVGIHSQNGPVIKPLVSDYLRSHPAVAKFSTAKIGEGGDGVLVIRLAD